MQQQEQPDCAFCQIDKQREILLESELALAFFDKYPVSPGHVLIIPKRHCSDYFDLSNDEKESCWDLADKARKLLINRLNPHGFNIGVNINEAAGQTIPHAHIHIIPRYFKDVDDPEGGVRGVIPKNRKYK